ncbi:GNAT family N-acetyltransferase [Burkholderia sp. S171]|uniref:GNAT family N-acetyltransferase n=1 Tax=Burkholderia sp. S171 TaxID=1641860 RepID=UPI00131B0F18|nr:N-acetyltransferase [Burkholderia sp. S171]
MNTDFEITPAQPADWPAIWPILQKVLAAGSNFVFPTDFEEESMCRIWFGKGTIVFKVLSGGQVVGSYFIRPNHSGPGSHVANAAYATHSDFRRKGIGGAMCQHSIATARDRGFSAMQFNEVIGINTAATKLYARNGFNIVGRIPDGYIDEVRGRSDLLIFHREV